MYLNYLDLSSIHYTYTTSYMTKKLCLFACGITDYNLSKCLSQIFSHSGRMNMVGIVGREVGHQEWWNELGQKILTGWWGFSAILVLKNGWVVWRLSFRPSRKGDTLKSPERWPLAWLRMVDEKWVGSFGFWWLETFKKRSNNIDNPPVTEKGAAKIPNKWPFNANLTSPWWLGLFCCFFDRFVSFHRGNTNAFSWYCRVRIPQSWWGWWDR